MRLEFPYVAGVFLWIFSARNVGQHRDVFSVKKTSSTKSSTSSKMQDFNQLSLLSRAILDVMSCIIGRIPGW